MIALTKSILKRTLSTAHKHPDVEVLTHVLELLVVELPTAVRDGVTGGTIHGQDPLVQQGLDNGLCLFVWD